MNPGVAFFMLLLLIPPVAFLVWPFAAIIKMSFARGTRQRYVASSVERAFRYPFLIGQLVLAGLDAKAGDWGDFAMCLIAVVLAAMIIHQFGDDDDDIWTKLKKKLQDKVAGWSFAPGLG